MVCFNKNQNKLHKIILLIQELNNQQKLILEYIERLEKERK